MTLPKIHTDKKINIRALHKYRTSSNKINSDLKLQAEKKRSAELCNHASTLVINFYIANAAQTGSKQGLLKPGPVLPVFCIGCYLKTSFLDMQKNSIKNIQF